jgi:murein DD-endopeptidase MepM/ murein hydrolase activator NlpD
MATPLSKNHMKHTTEWLYKDKKQTIHAGFDYPVDMHTPVYAVRAGRILKKVDNIKNLAVDKDGESGDPPNYILLGIRYKGQPATVVYLHVSPHLPVREGDEVEAGDWIGLSGHNGHSTGPHLHVSALKGHNHTRAFAYLDDLKNGSKPPKDGLASNNLTIYPPSLVYGLEKPGKLDGGDVVVADLKFGTRDSDSVRKLQHVLNRIPRKGGRHLPVNGDYRARTRDQVITWQVQVRHQKPGSARADGNVHPHQAEILFKSPPFTLI